MKRLATIAAVLVILAMLLALTGWAQYRSFLAQPLDIPAHGHVLEVRKGATVRSVIAELDTLGFTSQDWRWRLLTRLQPLTIKAGEYSLSPGLKAEEILALLSTGSVISYQITIIEGWTFKQLKQALAMDAVLNQEVPQLDSDQMILEAIESDAEHPEGWFLPETYQFVRGDSDLDILRRAHEDMQTLLESTWQSRMDDLPLKTPYELLTLASIIEKESGLDSERARIAGVFIRRLEARWRLETDPTVIYGIGDSYDGDIRNRDLTTDTPYNTYTRYGLPPTPIAMPGKASLLAAAAPADGTAMFFVASGTGGHVFSDTLEQHNVAVRKMLRRQP